MTVGRAFGSLDECVADGVLAACGAYQTAHLKRIYDSIEQREERYFNEGKLRDDSVYPWQLGVFFF